MNEKDLTGTFAANRHDEQRILVSVNRYDATRSQVLSMAEQNAKLTADNARLRERIAELERGEFICNKCGLRKDGDYPKGDF